MHNIQEVTILLVEDDPSHARLIEKNLHRLNVTNDVVTVGDGQQAASRYILVEMTAVSCLATSPPRTSASRPSPGHRKPLQMMKQSVSRWTSSSKTTPVCPGRTSRVHDSPNLV